MFKLSACITIALILGMVSSEKELEPEKEPLVEYTPRVLAHITTDKPVYKPNDMAFIEAYIFDPTTNGPATLMTSQWDNNARKSVWVPKKGATANVAISDMQDNEIYSNSNVAVQFGTVAFTYKVPKDAKGGEYTIKVTGQDFADSFRKFRINQFSQPELFVTVDFKKQNYSNGDTVVAKVKVRRPDGEALQPGSSIAYEVPMSLKTGKDAKVSKKMIELNSQGEVEIQFDIPSEELSQAVISVAMSTYIGYTQEKGQSPPVASQHSVPLLKKDDFDVEFHTEFTVSNLLVAGVRNKVYFQVLDKTSRAPIDFNNAKLIEVQGEVTEDITKALPINQGASELIFTAKASTEVFTINEQKAGGYSEFKNVLQDSDEQKKFKEDTLVDLIKSKGGELDAKLAQNPLVPTKYASQVVAGTNYRVIYATVNNEGKPQTLAVVFYEDFSKKIKITSVSEATDEDKKEVVIPEEPTNYFLRVYRQDNDDYLQFSLPKADKTAVINIDLSGTSTLNDQGTLSMEIQRAAGLEGEKTLQFELYNRDIQLYTEEKKVNMATKDVASVEIKMTERGIVAHAPNGGVLTLRISEDNTALLERLVFLRPSSKQTPGFKLSTDKKDYQPGDKVTIEVEVTPEEFDKAETFHASVVVTDVSSFLEVPKHKLMPSLPAMVHLEKEIKQLNGKVCDFDNSADYIDDMYDGTEKPKQINVDLLLATQSWRKGKSDFKQLEKYITSAEEGSEDRLRLEYLYAKKVEIFRPPVMANMEMPMREMMMDDGDAAPPMMEKGAQEDEPMMAKGGEVEEEKKEEPEKKEAGKEEDESKPLSEQDFMSYDVIKKNTREYAHSLRKDYDKLTRVDFTQTLAFTSAMKVELQEGEGTYKLIYSLNLNDQVSKFQISVNLFSSKGKLSTKKMELTSSMPAYSKFTLPTTLLRGDKVDIPITVVNNYDSEQTVKLRIIESVFSPKLTKVNSPSYDVVLDAKSQKKTIHSLDVSSDNFKNQKFVQIEAEIVVNDEVADRVTKMAYIMVNGFIDEKSQGGRIGIKDKSNPDKYKVEQSASWEVTMPETIASTPYFTAKLFAKPLDSILDALESLIRDPYGCFEQTSSTTYPMVMALQLLNEMQKGLSKEEDIARVRQMKYQIMEKLKKGYDRLTTFETSTKGYEWFGKSPGHEALSAYGIAQFNDMNTVVNFVSEADLNRNVDWLMDRRNPDKSGHWELNPKALDTFGRASQDVTDAYLVWVMTQNGKFSYDDLENEFKNLKKVSETSEDPYILALYSGALFNVGKKEEAIVISARIVGSQNEVSGAVEGAESSITNSRGQGLLLETTSLSLINWLNQDASRFSGNIDLGVGFLLSSIKKGGRFGSTQSTVMTLKALVRYTQLYAGIQGKGKFVAYLNGEKVKELEFDQNADFSMSKLDFSEAVYQAFAKKHPNDCAAKEKLTIKLAIEDYTANEKGDGFALSFLMGVEFKNTHPFSSEKTPITFDITKTPSSVNVGQSQTHDVKIKNISGKSQGMVVAQLSTTACDDIDMNQLTILKDGGSIDNYELSADKTSVTLYWTYLKEEEEKNVKLFFQKKFDASADAECQRRASQAYLYYQDEDKVWIKEPTKAKTVCEVEEIDYSEPRDPIPDPVEPPKPPPFPPIWIMEGRPAPIPERRPVMALLAIDADQQAAMDMWDPVPNDEDKKRLDKGEPNGPGEEGNGGPGEEKPNEPEEPNEPEKPIEPKEPKDDDKIGVVGGLGYNCKKAANGQRPECSAGLCCGTAENNGADYMEVCHFDKAKSYIGLDNKERTFKCMGAQRLIMFTSALLLAVFSM